MILKALYDYYNRCDNMAPVGYEYKELEFLIVIGKDGVFRYIENCRVDKKHCKMFLVPKTVTRSGSNAGMYPCLLWDNVNFVLGVQKKDTPNPKGQYLDAFKMRVKELSNKYPDSERIKAVDNFYKVNDDVQRIVSSDSLYNELVNTMKGVSFRIEGDTKIVAEEEVISNELCKDDDTKEGQICMVTGKRSEIARLHHKTPLPSATFASLISFQKSSGYDSYGKEQAYNAPISVEAEFAYTSALNIMLDKDSRNKFSIGNRTFLFWASSNNDACRQTEESIFSLFGFSEQKEDNPNAKIEQVRKVFNAIYSGQIKTTLDDKFFILGLAPNSARIAVVFWSETTLKDFAGKIMRHFVDMEIVDLRKEERPYMGLKDILSCVTLGGKQSDATPNLPDAVVKSIFMGYPYPQTLFASCIRRIRAEQDIAPYNSPCRAAILKAYLNRSNTNNNKAITVMLDKENTNKGYLCGRLFAVLDRIQEKANNQHSIQERYMNAASATPAAVFATILNLSNHHTEKLDTGLRIYFEKLKQEIIAGLTADGFPAHLDLQDQGRFFIGFYHQRQDFFAVKQDESVTE